MGCGGAKEKAPRPSPQREPPAPPEPIDGPRGPSPSMASPVSPMFGCEAEDRGLFQHHVQTVKALKSNGEAWQPANALFHETCAELQAMWHFKTPEDSEELVAKLRGFNKPPKTVLVMGQSGTGKSSLIKALVKSDPDIGPVPDVGTGYASCTKQVKEFCGHVTHVEDDREEVVFIDTPGFDDDGGLTNPEIWRRIDERLREQPIDAVLLLAKANTTGGTGIIRTMALMIASATRQNESPWPQVILVGTQKDEALGEHDDLERDGVKLKRFEAFKQTMPAYLNKLVIEGQPVAIQEQMVVVTQVGERNGNPEDLRELKRAIAGIQRGQLLWHSLTDAVLCKVIGAGFCANEHLADIQARLALLPTTALKRFKLAFTGGAYARREYALCMEPTDQLSATLSYLAYHVPELGPGATTPEGADGDLLLTLQRAFPTTHFLHTTILHVPMSPIILTASIPGCMIIAFRGTKSISDVVVDLFASPAPSPHLNKSCPEMQVHEGMHATVEAALIRYMPAMLQLISEHRASQVIFTGHSLGGGLAQIALADALAKKLFGGNLEAYAGDDLTQEQVREKIETLKFRAITFAAPMVFHFDNTQNLKPNLNTLTEALGKSKNYVSFGDMVPRMPGMPEYWVPALKDMINKVSRDHFVWPVSGVVSALALETAGKVLEALEDSHDMEYLKLYQPVLAQHVVVRDGDSEDSEPGLRHATNFESIKYDEECAPYLLQNHSELPLRALPPQLQRKFGLYLFELQTSRDALKFLAEKLADQIDVPGEMDNAESERQSLRDSTPSLIPIRLKESYRSLQQRLNHKCLEDAFSKRVTQIMDDLDNKGDLDSQVDVYWLNAQIGGSPSEQ
eukprot:TRINITY_DN433_c0_g1_i4.p1 TRINITY_DN433_c0_g1~~TRINITY_DN433_c0_g1_i4.p1  ORF type:complete len:852 (-),score=113.70 TRINITY_DN433_c0_g1_i4:123-2678(-)